MTRLPLNCPHCHTSLVYVPLDGLTLHYRCPRHGAVILRPLVVVELDEAAMPSPDHDRLRSNDAA